MEIQSIPSFKGNPVRIGKLVQKRIQELRYIRGLADSLGQTDKDYLILQEKLKKTAVVSSKEIFSKERTNEILADILGQTGKDLINLKSSAKQH